MALLSLQYHAFPHFLTILFLFSGQTHKASSVMLSGLRNHHSNNHHQRKPLLQPNQTTCALFTGTWIRDDSYPVYQSSACPIIDPQFNCQMYGRPDSDYLKYRWQPANCELPRFDGLEFLSKMRGKSVMFVGDSLGRNQWESLICLVSAGVPRSATQMMRGDPLSTFKFLDYGVSVSFYRAPYLVDIDSMQGKRVLKLDDVSGNGNAWRDADVLSFDTGHWWSHKGGLQGLPHNTSNPPKPMKIQPHPSLNYHAATAWRRRFRVVELRRDCPYLDTVNRQVLDFDFEKFCSVSLSNLNVYACLVCGKYYQGRGQKSHAYTHSLEAAGHHVFINLRTEKVYCLPDEYEIEDPSLDDIRHVLNPRFDKKQVADLDRNKQWSGALDGSDPLPGMVGLNNIKDTDFVNVTIQSLMRVTPLRDFFLIPENYQHNKSPLVHRFGELTRKIWHAPNFKGQVSPHEFLQAVMKASDERFRIGAQSDPVEFMSWLLNTLHADLSNSKKSSGSSIIYKCFQGELEVIKDVHGSRLVSERKENGDEQKCGSAVDGGTEHNGLVTETSRMPFLMLGLDLPPPPFFKDVMEEYIIPQVPLFNILNKFDGESITEVVRPRIASMRYRVTRLPQYLILHMRWFTKNNFFVEKNPTLVNFPVKNLELKDYIPLPTPKENQKLRSKYDLIANVVHDGKPGEGSYRAFVQQKSEALWYEMQDLHVSETRPQMVALSETYMQIYEQQKGY